jgi:hypothetical protein
MDNKLEPTEYIKPNQPEADVKREVADGTWDGTVESKPTWSPELSMQAIGRMMRPETSPELRVIYAEELDILKYSKRSDKAKATVQVDLKSTTLSYKCSG